MFKSIFVSSYIDNQKTIASLLAESQDTGRFYFLLSLGTFMATLGLLIDDVIVVIAAMLVAPILFPILSLAMAIATSSRVALLRSFKIISRSIGLVFIISLVTAFLLGSHQSSGDILNSLIPDIFLYLISFAAGLAVAFTWVQKDMSAVLPGIAVSASLIVPLSAVGVGLSSFDRLIIAGSITLFAINLLSIVLAGVVIFALFGFANLQAEEEEKITEKNSEQKIQEEAIKSAEEESVETV
ncbi:MAG: DUF389 domain-containing protein [Candidatus Paceibacterota bacterium]